ncbi:MAG: hypothetical protein Q4A15_05435 [Prevotellaceae bacterium]|nr:hypothetical protein [Prevotellaceae bacterium]
MGYIVIIAGVLICLVGVWMLNSKQGEEVVAKESKVEVENEVDKNTEDIGANNLSENEEKGRAFEAWCVDHFNRKYFQLKEWRGDKIQNGVYAESNRYPDMEWEFNHKGECHEFAIECKYRSEFHNGAIVWADDENIAIYNEFATNRQMDVFVVIGIGGTADKPERVFCVPLSKLKYGRATEEYLKKFEHRNIDDNFYYDFNKVALY